MKKLSILLILALLIGSVTLTSCGGNEEPEGSETESITAEAPESESESESEAESEDQNKLDPSQDAIADDIYSNIDPEVIG